MEVELLGEEKIANVPTRIEACMRANTKAGPERGIAGANAMHLLFTIPKHRGMVSDPSDVPLLGFSMPVDPSSVSARSVCLLGPVGRIDGRLHVAETMVSFIPDQPLVWDTTYVFQVSRDVKAVSGEHMVSNAQVRFTTSALCWHPPEMIHDVASKADCPAVSLDDAGNAVAVWRESMGGRQLLRAARYEVSKKKWSAAVVIRAVADDIEAPQVAMDRTGNAMVLWSECVASLSSAWVCTFDAVRNDWTDSFCLSGADGNVQSVQLAMNADGHALVIWKRQSESGARIQSVRFDAHARRWSQAVNLSDQSAEVGAPKIAMNAGGSAAVVWPVRIANRQKVMTIRYSGRLRRWSMSAALPESDAEVCSLRVATNDAGEAMVIWVGGEAERGVLKGAALDIGTGLWSMASPAAIVNADVDAFAPAVALDPAGKAIVLWVQGAASTNSIVVAACFDIRTGAWHDPVVIQKDSGGSYGSQVAIDGAGNAVALWAEKRGFQYHVMTCRYSASSAAWGKANSIQADAGSCICSSLHVHAGGRATAVWLQNVSRGYVIGAAMLAVPKW